MKALREWQRESYDRWRSTGYFGCILARTGSGKTVSGVSCISRFKQDFPFANVLIIVPSQKLIKQWADELKEQLVTGIPIMTYLQAINRMYRGGLKADCLILDECHRIAPNKQSSKVMELNPRFVLGLSATPGASVQILGKPFYTVDWEESNLCPFFVHYAKFKPTDEEMKEYDKWTMNMKRQASECTNGLTQSLPPGRNSRYDFFVRMRRNVCYSFDSRVPNAVNLIRTYRNKRTVVFAERNDTIDAISKALDREGIDYAICNQRTNTLDRFEKHQCNILLLAKMLREGWNDPTLEIEILVAPTTRELSHTQMVGRVQRRDPNNPNKVAHIITMVAEGTSDENIIHSNDFPKKSVETTTVQRILDIAPGLNERQLVTRFF